MKFIDVHRVRSRFDEAVTARDGVRLSVDIYLPGEQGRYPVLVTRTPYDNNHTKRAPGATTMLPAPADRFKKLAAHGFIVVACDVRGRGDSDGSFVPFASDAGDGADTVEWARRLPEADGRVGVFGSGYAGFTALVTAVTAPVDAVAAWSPIGAEETPFSGGALRLDWLFWMHLVGGRTIQPVDVPDWNEILRHRPLRSLDTALGRDDIPWAEWLDRAPDSWLLELGAGLSTVTAPTLLVTGWWDGALRSTARYWEALRRDDGAVGHALVVGPWDTQAVREPRADVGGVAWGPTALLDRDEMVIDWFRTHLEHEGAAPRGARIFLTGRNEWVTREPLQPVMSPTVLWLTSDGGANTRRGDGHLVATIRDDAVPDRFTYNPENPVPWQPGFGSFSRNAPTKLTLDTAFATARDDVLVYDAAPAGSDLVICGYATAYLWVQSDAQDADWIAALEDVFPGGAKSVHLAHGIVRVGARDGAEPGRPLELAIQLSPIGHELLTGHTLRLVVTSSLWPLYAVNFGGQHYLDDVEPRISEHTVFHDSRFPSRIELPVASAEADSPARS